MLHLSSGVYADIVLVAGEANCASDPSWPLPSAVVVHKVVRAPRDGKDASRVPHDIVLEATLLSALSHPNIIPLLGYAYEASSSTHRLALPLLACPLADVPTPPRRLLSPAVRTIAWQALSALSFLHDRGVAHRDINPRNIMLDWHGVIQLIDLSTAHAPPSLGGRPAGEPMVCQVGTGAYRAPELLFGAERYDPAKTDVWALACVLAEFLESELPRDEDAAEDTDDPLEDELMVRSATHHRTPLFSAAFGDIGLAASIFRQRGSPRHSWPEFTDLPDSSKVCFEDCPPRPLADSLRLSLSASLAGGKETLDLLDRMLALSPARRVSAADALRHALFAAPVLVPPTYPPSGRATTTALPGLTYDDLFGACLARAREEIQRRIQT